MKHLILGKDSLKDLKNLEKQVLKQNDLYCTGTYYSKHPFYKFAICKDYKNGSCIIYGSHDGHKKECLIEVIYRGGEI